MTFKTEAEFEQAFIETLFNKGWESAVLKNPTEQDLINNWAKILFENNSGIDRLNGQPLTDSEMAQILEQIKNLRTPLALNGFIMVKLFLSNEITQMMQNTWVKKSVSVFMTDSKLQLEKAVTKSYNNLNFQRLHRF